MSKKKNFEELIDELEGIVKRLESGETSLEESLESFEKGTKLYKDCKDILTSAEKKILVLSEKLKEEELT